MMKTTSLSAGLLSAGLASCMTALMLGTAAFAAEPTKLWELDGFKNPESALPDPKAGIIYVSNVNGAPPDKDGNGFISKVSVDGKIIKSDWVTGLDAPKGLVLSGTKLFVSDIDKLVEIDTATGKILAKYEAPGAKFLNDTAVDKDGNIYVSDMVTSVIWRLSGGKFESWLESPALINPNGLYVEGETLIVAAWGVMTDGFATKVPGHMLQVSLKDKSVKDLGNGTPVGNLDGLEPLDADSFLVSDWMAGKLYKIARSGEATLLLTLSPGSADLGYDPATKTVFMPLMKDDKVAAFKLP